jgi:hypothetical protein
VKFNWLDRPMDLERARYWVLAPAAIGGVIDALEALSRIDQYGEDGILRGRSAGRPRRFLPQGLLRHLDSTACSAVLEGRAVGSGPTGDDRTCG